MDNSAVSSLFVFFVTTTLIIIAAHYATKFLGRTIAQVTRGKHIGLLEKRVLPGNIIIEVVKVGKYVYVIASKGKELTTLDRHTTEVWDEIKLDAETLQQEEKGEHMKSAAKVWGTMTAGRLSLDFYRKRPKKGD